MQTKLKEEIRFEVCPYGDSGNGIAAAARRSLVVEPAARRRAVIETRGHSELRAFGTGGVRNWGRNRAVKTHRLVAVFYVPIMGLTHFNKTAFLNIYFCSFSTEC